MARIDWVAIYVIIGYFGGIVLPLFLMVIGVATIISGGKRKGGKYG